MNISSSMDELCSLFLFLLWIESCILNDLSTAASLAERDQFKKMTTMGKITKMMKLMKLKRKKKTMMMIKAMIMTMSMIRMRRMVVVMMNPYFSSSSSECASQPVGDDVLSTGEGEE
jgi:hypothetical protein